MEPWEVMTSESQERMLAIVTPESLARGGRQSAPLGGAGDRGRAGDPARAGRRRAAARPRRLDGPVLADVPAASLSDDAPLYDRPAPARRPRRADAAPLDAAGATAPPTCWRCCVDPRWVYRQYDHQLFLNTVVGPGADAALLRLAGPGLPAR